MTHLPGPGGFRPDRLIPVFIKEAVAANDSDIKERVEKSLNTDAKMKDVTVASVNNGVVVLSVIGVHRVASEIQTTEN